MTPERRTKRKASEDPRMVEGTVFSVDQTAVHDGPGVRMNVYLKGCPLRCRWCHSPESQAFDPEVVWYETRCERCGRCVEVCPENLRSLDGVEETARTRCRLCGACVQVCPADALEIKGTVVTAGQVADDAARLKPFFRRTNGGVTLTGGEPLAQPEFSRAVALLCRAADIHVAIETCGCVPWKVLSSFLPCVDLFLYDVKLPDEARHREQTGVSNRRILQNLRRLCRAGADVTVRVPLIPGVNDDEKTVRAIGRRTIEAGARRITLLPFNPATSGKYSWVGRETPLDGAARQSGQYLELLQLRLREDDLEVVPP